MSNPTTHNLKNSIRYCQEKLKNHIISENELTKKEMKHEINLKITSIVFALIFNAFIIISCLTHSYNAILTLFLFHTITEMKDIIKSSKKTRSHILFLVGVIISSFQRFKDLQNTILTLCSLIYIQKNLTIILGFFHYIGQTDYIKHSLKKITQDDPHAPKEDDISFIIQHHTASLAVPYLMGLYRES